MPIPVNYATYSAAAIRACEECRNYGYTGGDCDDSIGSQFCTGPEYPHDDYPVSGDDTTRQFGYSVRQTPSASLWHRPNVKPRHATAGIVKGGLIDLWHLKNVTVTRVGTVSGFYSHEGKEHPFYMAQVTFIHPRA